MDVHYRMSALAILSMSLISAGCLQTGSGSAGNGTVKPRAVSGATASVGQKVDHQTDAARPSGPEPAIGGAGSINIAGGALKIASLGDSMRINFVGGGGGRLYVNTTDRTAKAIASMIDKGRILVDGGVQKDLLPSLWD